MDFKRLEVSRYIELLQQVVEGRDKLEWTYMVKETGQSACTTIGAQTKVSARKRVRVLEVVMTLFPATNFSRRSLMQDEL